VVAKGVAYAIPQSVGPGRATFLDGHVFAPSQLDAARQQALRARFARLSPPACPSRIIFRKSKIGPPFAPAVRRHRADRRNGALMPDDDAIMGVLAHELGHTAHLTRRLIQTSAVGAARRCCSATVVATLPPLLLDLKYSRVEREADYAIAMLRQNGIALEHGAGVRRRASWATAPYLSSHPASAERIARIRAADALGTARGDGPRSFQPARS
jgi:hypothetical protein